MPVTIEKNDGKYTVKAPGGVKAKGTTLRNAKRQKRLLQAIDHGWEPDKKKKKKPSFLKELFKKRKKTDLPRPTTITGARG